MHAALRTKYGGPEVLLIKEIPTPVPSHNEILVKVHATSVNRTDCGVLKASPFVMRFFTGLFGPKLPCTGTDFAGEVHAVGGSVDRFKPGDRVWGFLDNGCGSHAEYFVAQNIPNIRVLPDSISYIDAVCSAEGAHYALNFINKIDITPNCNVLVNGATGAIGSAALQIVKSMGANVVATANSENLDIIKELGADRVINFETTDFTNDHEKFDFVLDTVGKSRFEKCRKVMKERAVYLSSELGPNVENLYLPLLTKNRNQKVIFPVPTNIPATLETMEKMLLEGSYKPLIDREYPLDQIREAFTYVDSGQKTGNVVLRVS